MTTPMIINDTKLAQQEMTILLSDTIMKNTIIILPRMPFILGGYLLIKVLIN